MGDYGLKISKVGEDVSTADDRKLILSSSWLTYKIVSAGTQNVTVNSGVTTTQSANIAHGLAYVPAVEVHVTIPTATGDYRIPAAMPSGLFNGDPAFDLKVDSTNLTVYVKHQLSHGSGITYTFNYVIFVEKIV